MDTEHPRAAQARSAGVSGERQARVRRARSRFVVHLGLLASVAAAFGTLQLLHIRNAIHADIGLAFGAFVLLHLAQRRHRLARMFAQLLRLRPPIERELRLLASDTVLAVVAANVVISGILDWGHGGPLLLPFAQPFSRWHLLSSAVLVVYLVVHVTRRWKRIRRSTIQ